MRCSSRTFDSGGFCPSAIGCQSPSVISFAIDFHLKSPYCSAELREPSMRLVVVALVVFMFFVVVAGKILNVVIMCV